MSRGKKRFGSTLYQPIAQAMDSEDEEEMVIFQASSPSSSSSPQTTQFGAGLYDDSCDLELPSVKRQEERRRRREKKRRGRKRLKLHMSREAQACLCMVVVLIGAVGLIALTFTKMTSFLPQPGAVHTTAVSSTSIVSETPHTFHPQGGGGEEGGGGEGGGEGTEGPVERPPPVTHTDSSSSQSSNTSSSTTATLAIAPTAALKETASSLGHNTQEVIEHSLSTTPTSSSSPSASPSSSPSPTSNSSPPPPPPPSTSNITHSRLSWEREFSPAMTETSLQLQDMNRDGIVDVIMSVATTACNSTLIALDGLTGETVWEGLAPYDAFAVRCDLDLNDDKFVDCIAAGRQSGFRALSGVDGSVLWDRDPRLAYLRYNFYFPLVIPDLDADGISDLINIHGGDSTYGEKDIHRSPSFLVVLSGRTGEQLMERVPTPDGHESYMSPVLFTLGVEEDEKEDVVLIGSGGETLPGSLWAVTIASLRERVRVYLEKKEGGEDYVIFRNYTNHPCANDMKYKDMEKLRPEFDKNEFDFGKEYKEIDFPIPCPSFGRFKPLWNNYGLCLYQLIKTQKMGVILPPVVVDMTGDGIEDIVISCFEGKTIVLDGRDGETVWEVDNPGTESYSIPAPLFFNADDTVDLLVRVNTGHYNNYNYSHMAVLDGLTGAVLWSIQSPHTGMMSGLSVAADTRGADAMLFVTVGYNTEDTPVVNKSVVGERERRGFSVSDRIRTCQEGEGECWEVEKEERRQRRHFGGQHKEGDDLGEAEDEEEIENENDGNDYDYVSYDDFMEQASKFEDPPYLWEGADFPDPTTDFPSFLSYCGLEEEDLTSLLFLLPHQVVEREEVLPLASHGPEIFIPPSHQKRHTVQDDPDHNKKLRCSHILSTDMVPSTPVISDVNEDGQLEVSYVLIWGGPDSASGTVLPSKLRVYLFTLQDRVSEVWGGRGEEEEGGEEWVRHFLPLSQQPWTRYMGAGGDNVFRPPNLTTPTNNR